MHGILIDDLAVVCFSSEILTEDLKKWRRDGRLFRPESCSRQIWVGSSEDFKGMPSENISLYEGRDAYAFLLAFIDGDLSKKKFETHAKNQFFHVGISFLRITLWKLIDIERLSLS